MLRSASRRILLLVALGLLVVVWSCDQTDDVTAPRSITKVWLSAERLPTPSPGMVYQLWAADTNVTAISGAAHVKSLGQFSYIENDTIKAFLEPATLLVRADSNQFNLEGDLFRYAYLLISVECLDSTPVVPGPILAMQEITGRTDTLRLRFPLSDDLWSTTVRYNMESPTDGNRWDLDGYGVWFSTYTVIRWGITDTLAATITYVWDTLDALIDPETGDTLNKPDLYKPEPDTVWFEFDTVLIDFGRDSLPLDISDSFVHFGARQRLIYVIDSTPPKEYKVWSIPVIDSLVRNVTLDVFIQDDFGLPDYSEYGWRYQGWIVSDHIPDSAVGEFTPPAWNFMAGENLFPGYQGGLLTTGTFTHVDQPDDSNPFTLDIRWLVDSGGFVDTVLKRPAIPGEDFLDGEALSAATNGVINSAFNLLPAVQGSQYGTVFISLEPINRTTDTTNSPYILFSRAFPDAYSTGGVGTVARQDMHNWSGTVSGANGMPLITARIRRL